MPTACKTVLTCGDAGMTRGYSRRNRKMVIPNSRIRIAIVTPPQLTRIEGDGSHRR
jgi:hypothetical protein